MYDVAGWFNCSPLKDSPNPLLRAMLPSAAKTLTGNNHAFAAKKDSQLGQFNAVTALIDGHPRWQDSYWAGLSSREGFPQALAKAYEAKGNDVLKLLSGDFSLALYHADRSEGLIAIDPLGICPLAYAEIHGNLVFAGDLSAFKAYPGIGGNPNPQALLAYLYFHMIPAPLSICDKVNKLLPGQYLAWKGGKVTSGFYWQPSFSDDDRPEPELAEELRATLKASVAACLENPSTTGAFLSGGLDSSTVTGLFKNLIPDAEAFSIGFAAQGYDEMEFARASARHFKVKLHEYYVTPEDVVTAIPAIAADYDEPFGNASAVPTFYCAKLARQAGKTCLLAGDGGDELFAGNARYAKQKMFALYGQLPAPMRSLLIEPLAEVTGNLPLLGKLKSYVEQAKIPMPERMETYNFLHRSPLTEIFEDDFLASVATDWPIGHLRELYAKAGTDSMLKRMLFLDWKITLADNDLRKVNRMCSLAGIDVRYPMLQMPVVDLAARIPDRLLMRGFQLRSFYRRAFKDFLPPSTLNKSKHGFGLPFGLWLQTDPALQALGYDSLNSQHFEGIVKKSYLQTLKSQQQKSHASYYGVMIWVLMMWAQWAEKHH